MKNSIKRSPKKIITRRKTRDYGPIRKFLRDNADSIQKHATKMHKEFLGGKLFRSERIHKYQDYHRKIIVKFAENLVIRDIRRGTDIFKNIGRKLAHDSVEDGLTLEEAVDGTIFLKQAFWAKLREGGMLNELSPQEFFEINQVIGTYCDIIASEIAFTYHDLLNKKSEEIEVRAKAIIDSSDDAIISKSLKGIILSWNKGAEALYGYTSAEAVGKPVSMLMPLGKKDDFPKIMGMLRRGRKVEHYETLRMRKNGEIFDVSLTVSPLRDQKGKIIGASKIARDITDKKRAEKNLIFLSNASKLLSSSLDYKTTLANVAKLAVPETADWCSVEMLEDGKFKQLAIAHKDPKKVIWASELGKKYPIDMNAPSGAPNVARTGKAEMYSDITEEMITMAARDKEHLKIIRKLGFTSVIVAPLCIGKTCIGVITFVATESRRKYTALDLATAEELANRASMTIENARLFSDSQKALQLRDEFISVASHELRTPVTSLKIFTQGLQRQFEKNGEGLVVRALSKMNSQVDKLNLLIQDLLNISKMQSGKLEFNEGGFDINALVRETIDDIQPTTQKHKIEIEGSVEKSVWGDKDRIGQVLTNLLTNAVKYSPHSTRVVVKLVPERDHAVVVVRDFGIGIDKQHQEKIFNQFYRVTESDERTFPGLGIGLYISNQIMRRHGDGIQVESTKGKGSSFTFTLRYKRPTMK